jgi:hypothetical protein
VNNFHLTAHRFIHSLTRAFASRAAVAPTKRAGGLWCDSRSSSRVVHRQVAEEESHPLVRVRHHLRDMAAPRNDPQPFHGGNSSVNSRARWRGLSSWNLRSVSWSGRVLEIPHACRQERNGMLPQRSCSMLLLLLSPRNATMRSCCRLSTRPVLCYLSCCALTAPAGPPNPHRPPHTPPTHTYTHTHSHTHLLTAQWKHVGAVIGALSPIAFVDGDYSPLFCLYAVAMGLSVVSINAIRDRDIDHELASGLKKDTVASTCCKVCALTLMLMLLLLLSLLQLTSYSLHCCRCCSCCHCYCLHFFCSFCSFCLLSACVLLLLGKVVVVAFGHARADTSSDHEHVETCIVAFTRLHTPNIQPHFATFELFVCASSSQGVI